MMNIFSHSQRITNLLKTTNWWKNKFVYTSQFPMSNADVKYQIVNVGSNPARFCFFYENVKGQNWSTGTQGLNMDLQILKKYSSCVEKNGIVLIPLVPFSLVSEYLDGNRAYRNYKNYLKYTEVLDASQIDHLPFANDIWGYLKSPLHYDSKAWKCLLHDVEPDIRLEITEQHMMLAELINDADLFIKVWKDEFDIKDLSDPLPEHLTKGRDDSVALLAEMIDFLLEREYRPVIVLPPMTSVLCDKFPNSFWKAYIYDGIARLNKPEIPVLDYLHDEKWQSADLYFNSLFMNLRGRKLFTKQVLKDVGLEK